MQSALASYRWTSQSGVDTIEKEPQCAVAGTPGFVLTEPEYVPRSLSGLHPRDASCPYSSTVELSTITLMGSEATNTPYGGIVIALI
jgi:hypothetical protein